MIGNGATLDKLSKHDKAYECYKKAIELDPKLEIASINDIIYIYTDDSRVTKCQFALAYNNVLMSTLVHNAKIRAERFIDADFEDIASNGYQGAENLAFRFPEKKISYEELQDIKGALLERGQLGEKYINYHLESLLRKGVIREFKWVSKENAISIYDFYIICASGERIFMRCRLSLNSLNINITS